jgi:hypothetical protein
MITATPVNTQIVRARMLPLLREHPAKALARMTGMSVRYSEKLRSGEREPSGAALLALMIHNDAMRAEILSLIEELAKCNQRSA